MEKKASLIKEFNDNRYRYQHFCDLIEHLIIELSSKHSTHSITSRVKTIKSLTGKLELKEKYNELSEITDLVGIRIITYFEKDVNEIADIIRGEFIIDEENSIDKRIKDDDRFGYSSLHLVCKLNNERTNLPEYCEFKEKKFEIQIRTILQHAWAEIEHDLGYKSPVDIPSFIKRKFYRLSSLLELADEEFEDISKLIDDYNDAIAKSIIEEKIDITIDNESIATYINNSYIVSKIFSTVSNKLGFQEAEPVGVAEGLVGELIALGYKSLQQIDEYLIDNNNAITKYMINFLEVILTDTDFKETGLGKQLVINFMNYHTVFSLDESEFKNEILKKLFLDEEVAEIFQLSYQNASR